VVFLLIMPYRTAENVIDGLVLTFVDINPVKQAQRSLHHLSKVFTHALEPIMIVDLQGRIVDLNDEVVHSYGWARDRGVEFRRIDKSGREHKGLLTLSLSPMSGALRSDLP